MKPSIFTILHIAALKLWPNCPKVRLTLRLIVRLFRGNFLVTGFLGAPQAKFFLPKSGFVGQNSGRSAVRCFPNFPTFYVKPPVEETLRGFMPSFPREGAETTWLPVEFLFNERPEAAEEVVSSPCLSILTYSTRSLEDAFCSVSRVLFVAILDSRVSWWPLIKVQKGFYERRQNA